jgi:hypothetical protein
MTLVNIAVLAVITLIGWWLSGYDAQVTGEDKSHDFRRRAIRCAVSLLLVAVFLWFMGLPGGIAALVCIPVLLTVPVAIGLLWCGCISEWLSHGVRRLIYPEDHRPFDPDQNLRDLDRVASLIRDGRKKEALKLCQMLEESGDVSVLALETMLEHLGVKPDRTRKPKPLVEAHRLRSEGRWREAEAILTSLLAEHPADVEAAILLTRIYAQDLRRADKAVAVLDSLAKQPQVPSSHIEYARRSIAEWCRGKPAPEAAAAQPESIDELLIHGYFGTVLEILEQKIKEQPGDFDLRIKLAEVYGQHCGDVNRAGKIVRELAGHPGFSPEQIQTAQARLDEWRKARPRRH